MLYCHEQKLNRRGTIEIIINVNKNEKKFKILYCYKQDKKNRTTKII